MNRTNCLLCKGTKLFEFLDMGWSPHSDQFRQTRDEPEIHYPLRLMFCEDCGLVQLSYVVDRAELFTKDYLYESSITQTARAHWRELATTAISTVGLKPEDRIVDIGSNDGTLLQEFKSRGFGHVVGVDPCPEVTEIARKNGIPTFTRFWEKGLIYGAKLIMGTNVFAHVSDYDAFMTAVVDSLREDGVFMFESPYLGDFLNGVEVDTVYHQHVTYLSLRPTVRFLATCGMEIFDIDFTPIHGGSFRCYCARMGQRTVSKQARIAIASESIRKADLLLFARQAALIRRDLMALLWALKAEGKTIAAVSAPAKGMTLMNWCGINDSLIDFVTERSKLKLGRYTPGSHIQIVGDEELVKRQPDYALLLAWNFSEEIMANNRGYRGKWIIPVPQVRIV